MGDLSEVWKAWNEDSKERRAWNREQSPKLLHEAGIEFVSKNVGAHLIIHLDDGDRVDFWPGTGKWKSASGMDDRGVKRLISWIKLQQ